MQDKRKRGGMNWGSLVGWLIFLLVIAGGPLYSLLRNAVGGTVALPANLIPLLIGGLVALSVLVSAVRALNNPGRGRGAPGLPTDPSAPRRPPNAAMPPFGGTSTQQRPPIPPAPRSFTMPTSGAPARPPQAPRFEPVLNPTIVALGVLGLLVLGAVGLFVLAGGLP